MAYSSSLRLRARKATADSQNSSSSSQVIAIGEAGAGEVAVGGDAVSINVSSNQGLTAPKLVHGKWTRKAGDVVAAKASGAKKHTTAKIMKVNRDDKDDNKTTYLVKFDDAKIGEVSITEADIKKTEEQKKQREDAR